MPRPVMDDYLIDEPTDNHSDVETEDRRSRCSKLNKKKRNCDVLPNSEPSTTRDFYATSQIEISQQSASSADNASETSSVSPKQNKKKKNKSKEDEDDCSSEEERWLHAIESGKLEEVDDELKKIKHKDPKLMTARQRAMLERNKSDSTASDNLLSLPSGYREKIITPEMLEEKAKKLLKRKQLADEKREHDKKKTMERLLKKSESKMLKLGQKSKGSKKNVPRLLYTNRKDIIAVSIPTDVSFPLNFTQRISTDVVLCGRKGCTNVKRYSCSRTSIALCSMECYKANLFHHGLLEGDRTS